MGNVLGTKLSRLIRERAYLSGALPGLQDRVSDLRADLKAANAAFKAGSARLAELDAAIGSLSVIDPAVIRPIQGIQRVMSGKHGEFRRELIRVLKEAEGAVGMRTLVRHMSAAFSLPMETSRDMRRAGDLVRRPLNIFRAKGAVKRLPDHIDTGEAYWMWID
jgi:hypothetical protein